jgi:adenosyl cobinamide kinase/adenosyl cobinamide phosphate guanylyltransferase
MSYTEDIPKIPFVGGRSDEHDENNKKISFFPAENILSMKRGIAERDNEIENLRARIHAKRFMLLQRRKAIDVVAKQNRFLKEVKKDYDKFYKELVKQKNDQVVAIEYLTNYIDNIMKEEGLSAEKINEAKREHKEMLSTIRSIKESLDEILTEEE